MYKRFFKITSGEIFDCIKSTSAQLVKRNKLVIELQHRLGAIETHETKDFTISGFRFLNEVDKSIWKKSRNGLMMPRLSSKSGKKLMLEIDSASKMPNIRLPLQLSGLDFKYAVRDGAGHFYSPAWKFYKLIETAVFVVPWVDSDSENECNEIYLNWNPPSDFIEIKEWEYLKMIDDIKITYQECNK